MSYKDKYLKTAEEGQGKELSLTIHKFEEKGDFIIGKLEAVEDFTGSEFDTDCKRYLFDTDEGRVSVVLGQTADASLKGLDIVGHVLYVRYEGKKKTKNNKEMNEFFIVDVTHAKIDS